MNHFIITFVAAALLIISGCDKSAPNNLPDDPMKSPMPESSTNKSMGNSGDEGIHTRPVEPGDQEIQKSPVKPDGDSTIIVPPPVADMPPEVVPDK